MSISTIRNIIEKPGCAIITGVVLAGAMTLSLFSMCPRGDQMGNQQLQSGPPIVTVGQQPVDFTVFQDLYNAQEQQYAQFGPLPPGLKASLLGGVMSSIVDQMILLDVAKARGITFTEEQALAEAERQFDTEIARYRSQMVMEGKLKANATDAEFNEEFKKLFGSDPATAKQTQLNQLREALAQEARRPFIYASLSQKALEQSFQKDIQVTDEQLEESYNIHEFKRILIGKTGEDKAAEAQKIYNELKGGASFEGAMEKYSVEPAQGKSIRDNRIDLTPRLIENNPDLKPLLELEPGDISQPMNLAEGTAIYKLIKIKSEVPKDFEAKKAEYRQQYIEDRARAMVAEELKKARENTKVAWASPGFEVLYNFNKAATTYPGPTGEAKVQQYTQLANQAKQAYENDPQGRDPAALAWFASIENVWESASDAQKAQLREDRIAATTAILQTTENPSLRLSLVDMYVEQKNDLAGQELLNVAMFNSQFDQAGQETYNQVNKKMLELEKAGLLTPDQKASIEKEQRRWVEGKKQSDEQQRMVEEEQKRLAEEAKKNAANNAPAGNNAPATNNAPAGNAPGN